MASMLGFAMSRRGCLLSGLFWLCQVSDTVAHPNLQNAMWAQFEASLVRVAVNVSLKELSVAQNVPLREPVGPESEWSDVARAHGAYVIEHLKLEEGGRAMQGRVLKVTPPSVMGDPETTVYQYELGFPYYGTPPLEISFVHKMLREWPYSEGVPWNLSYILRTKNEGSTETHSWLLSLNVPSLIETGWGSPQASSEGGSAPQGQGWIKWGLALVLTLAGGCAGAFWMRKGAPARAVGE